MDEVEQYCLRWKYHHSNLQFMFAQLLENQSLCDVTLACEGKTLRVHKIMLSACSAYFDSIFSKYEESDPIVILEGVRFEDVNALVEFMYRGEITVDKSKLNDLIETAEELQVKGLAAVSWRSSDVGWRSVVSDVSDNMDPVNTQNPLNGSKRKLSDAKFDEKQINQSAVLDESINYNLPHSATYQIPHFRAEAQPKVPNSPNALNSPVLKKRKLLDAMKVKYSNSLSENESDCEKDVTAKIKTAPEPSMPPVNSSPTINSNAEKSVVPLIPPDLPELQTVTKMSDHIQQGGWRPHFWELESTKRVMEAIKNKKIEMKTGAEILGVTYGTLYGRYREVHGYLKQPQREFWHDVRFADVLIKLKRKEISLFKAADLMNVTATALANHLAKIEREGTAEFSETLLPEQRPASSSKIVLKPAKKEPFDESPATIPLKVSTEKPTLQEKPNSPEKSASQEKLTNAEKSFDNVPPQESSSPADKVEPSEVKTEVPDVDATSNDTNEQSVSSEETKEEPSSESTEPTEGKSVETTLVKVEAPEPEPEPEESVKEEDDEEEEESGQVNKDEVTDVVSSSN